MSFDPDKWHHSQNIENYPENVTLKDEDIVIWHRIVNNLISPHPCNENKPLILREPCAYWAETHLKTEKTGK